MLVINVQAAIPIKEIDDKINALILLAVLFLWVLKFHFGSVFRIKNLE
jgi:hypothetical protein